MKPDAEYFRKLAYISSRADRHLVGRDMWTERDWKAQRQYEKEQRDRKARLIASLDPPLIIAPAPTMASFSLRADEGDRERQRRIAANRALEKAGVRPRLRW